MAGSLVAKHRFWCMYVFFVNFYLDLHNTFHLWRGPSAKHPQLSNRSRKSTHAAAIDAYSESILKMVQHQHDFRKKHDLWFYATKVVGHWRKILQGPPSCPVHQVAWEWESWHQWRKLQCVEKSLHYLQIRKFILVIADTKDIPHACITCTRSPKCKVILQQHGQIEQIQTETVVPWLPDAITWYHKVQLLCVWLWITVVDVFVVLIRTIIDFLR